MTLASLDLKVLLDSLGPLSDASRAAVTACVARPDERSWRDASYKMVAPDFTTLWQAVCAVDPDYPLTVPHGVAAPVPSRETLLAALAHAVSLHRARDRRQESGGAVILPFRRPARR